MAAKEEGLSCDALVLESLYLGGQPIIRPFLDRLRVQEFLAETLGRPDPRLKLPAVDSAMLLIRNFTLSRHPLYGVPEWVRGFVPEQLGIAADQVQLINDDRLGRTLDKLFECDRRTLMTRLIVNMVQQWGIDLERLHNDSTSLTFSGQYRPRPPRKDGKQRLKSE